MDRSQRMTPPQRQGPPPRRPLRMPLIKLNNKNTKHTHTHEKSIS